MYLKLLLTYNPITVCDLVFLLLSASMFVYCFYAFKSCILYNAFALKKYFQQFKTLYAVAHIKFIQQLTIQ